MSKAPFKPNKHFRTVIDYLNPTFRTKSVSDATYFMAFLLADGFGTHLNKGLTEAEIKAKDYYYDWSHFRDSSEEAIETVAKYLKSVGG